jgi:hypothetical protein
VEQSGLENLNAVSTTETSLSTPPAWVPELGWAVFTRLVDLALPLVPLFWLRLSLYSRTALGFRGSLVRPVTLLNGFTHILITVCIHLFARLHAASALRRASN